MFTKVCRALKDRLQEEHFLLNQAAYWQRNHSLTGASNTLQKLLDHVNATSRWLQQSIQKMQETGELPGGPTKNKPTI